MLVLFETSLISPDMFVLHPALSHFGLLFSHPPPFFFFNVSVLFWQEGVFFYTCHPKTMPGWFTFTFFFYYHGGFMNVHQRFGDERGEIIQIPALPLSRSDSLTKLSDSILAPTARVNLLCHLQSTRGSATSLSSPCQNSPTVLLYRSIKVCFLPVSPITVCISAYISDLCLGIYFVFIV